MAGSTGVLVPPFGLALDAGVKLAVDDQSAIEARYSTWVPSGCLVPLALDADFVSRLRADTTLNLLARANQTTEPVKLAVSLKGLTSALSRIADLMEPRARQPSA